MYKTTLNTHQLVYKTTHRIITEIHKTITNSIRKQDEDT